MYDDPRLNVRVYYRNRRVGLVGPCVGEHKIPRYWWIYERAPGVWEKGECPDAESGRKIILELAEADDLLAIGKIGESLRRQDGGDRG